MPTKTYILTWNEEKAWREGADTHIETELRNSLRARFDGTGTTVYSWALTIIGTY